MVKNRFKHYVEQRTSPKVSIITACLNSEKHIEETIQSVIGQTYPHIEYIIVDGCSNDGTLGIVNKYLESISKVISEKDRGIYDAFNKGICNSTGDIIYFLGSDDYLIDPEVVADVVETFMETNAQIVYGNVALKESILEGLPFRKIGRQYTIEDFKKGHMPHHAGVFTCRDLFENVGLFNEKYRISGDFDYVLRCFLQAPDKMIYLNRVVNVFRDGGLSSGISTREQSLQETFTIVKHYFDVDYSPAIQSQIIGEYYKKWLTQFVLTRRTLMSTLYKQGVRKVAVFGTLQLALILAKELVDQNIEVSAFIDNDVERQNCQISGVEVYSPDWLTRDKCLFDTVLVAIESSSDRIVKQQVERLVSNKEVSVITWRELVERTYWGD